MAFQKKKKKGPIKLMSTSIDDKKKNFFLTLFFLFLFVFFTFIASEIKVELERKK